MWSEILLVSPGAGGAAWPSCQIPELGTSSSPCLEIPCPQWGPTAQDISGGSPWADLCAGLSWRSHQGSALSLCKLWGSHTSQQSKIM